MQALQWSDNNRTPEFLTWFGNCGKDRRNFYICTVNQDEIIDDFSQLGALLGSFLSKQTALPLLGEAIQKSVEANHWFIQEHIRTALQAIVENYLQREKLAYWLSAYSKVWHGYRKEVTVVMAGNVPLAGFHDYLSVLASGRMVLVKRSSKDAFLLPALHHLLCTVSPAWHSRVRFVEEVPCETDGLIATGSDATAEWFASRYSGIPKIVRGHRVSVAVLLDNVSREQIANLHRDMFLYFGLGCRSVVRLFVPAGFDLLRVVDVDARPVEAAHPGFRNAYRRQKAMRVLQGQPFVDGGFFLLQQADGWYPPMATVYYTRYEHLDYVRSYLGTNAGRIQCVVGADAGIKNCITFGSAQNPQLWDYADGIDTMTL